VSDDRPENETDPPPVDPDLSAVERRAFLRQLTGEAVVTSARLAGLSMAVRRGLFAAAESATREVGLTGPEPDGPAPAEATAMPAPAAPPPPPAPPMPVPPVAPAPLSPRQEALLVGATTAILGTNDATGSPHLTASRFHWDGTVVRLPSDLFAARVERIESDARVSLLVTDDGPDAWVAINGTASIVSGDDVEAAMLPILRKDMTAEEAERAWTEIRSSGNPVVIEVKPSRYLWRLG
jgi:pyridoxamine 5'-phosphate oxidase-like protein